MQYCTPPEQADSKIPRRARNLLIRLGGTDLLTLLCYLLVGGIAFLVDFFVFFLLVRGFGVNSAFAQMTSRTAGALSGFWGHRHFSFGAGRNGKDARALPAQAVGYLALTAFGIAVSPLILYAALALFSGRLVISKFATEVVMISFNFIAMRKLFRRAASPSRS